MNREEHNQHTFDTYCKRIVKNEAVNIQKAYQRQAEMEVTFSDLTEKERNQLQYNDQYAPERQTFPVLGMDVEIMDGDLARALAALAPTRRDIVLLAYLLDMTGSGIAQLLNLGRSTVQYQRTSSLAELRKILEEYENEYAKP